MPRGRLCVCLVQEMQVTEIDQPMLNATNPDHTQQSRHRMIYKAARDPDLHQKGSRESDMLGRMAMAHMIGPDHLQSKFCDEEVVPGAFMRRFFQVGTEASAAAGLDVWLFLVIVKNKS